VRERRRGDPLLEETVMHCPFCRHADSRVVDSRTSDDGASIRRRRQCPQCQRRFTTIETASLSVVKRSGVTEPFSREKIVTGVRKACQGRPVDEDDLALLAQRVEETIRASGSAELDAYEIGLAILGPLRELDEVAYLRFASVYQAFDSLEDFESAITSLRVDRAQRAGARAASTGTAAGDEDLTAPPGVQGMTPDETTPREETPFQGAPDDAAPRDGAADDAASVR
jgi:transcriptional repressor NrdR